MHWQLAYRRRHKRRVEWVPVDCAANLYEAVCPEEPQGKGQDYLRVRRSSDIE
jgi:hypothetical protein